MEGRYQLTSTSSINAIDDRLKGERERERERGPILSVKQRGMEGADVSSQMVHPLF